MSTPIIHTDSSMPHQKTLQKELKTCRSLCSANHDITKTPQQSYCLPGKSKALDASESSDFTARTCPMGFDASPPEDTFAGSLTESDSSLQATKSPQQLDNFKHNTDSNKAATASPPKPSSRQLSRRASHLSAVKALPQLDEDILARLIAGAGSNAFGCIFVEMWVLSENGMKLFRPVGGHWMNSAFATSLPNEALIDKAWELDQKSEEYPPGAGLPGILADESGLGSGGVNWRRIEYLLQDPLLERGPGRRMERLLEIGIGLVAAVPFSFIDGKGMVLYYTRSTADPEKLQSSSNVSYMINSADLVGAIFAIRKSRDSVLETKRNMCLESFRKVKRAILEEVKGAAMVPGASLLSMVLDEEIMEELRVQRAAEQEQHGDGWNGTTAPERRLTAKVAKLASRGLRRLNNSRRKWEGSHLHAPPRQSFSVSLFAFVGVFLTMLTILYLEMSVEDTPGNFDAG